MNDYYFNVQYKFGERRVIGMRIHVPSLVLSIIGLVFALLLPIVTYPCSIVGLVLAVRKRSEYKTTAALVMCIIGLVLAAANSILGVIMTVGMMAYF
jgi:hypothetical protein